jgi:hypothetical protein
MQRVKDFDCIQIKPAGTTPEAVAQFRPPEAQLRVADLIEFLELEHIPRMAEARARQILARGR